MNLNDFFLFSQAASIPMLFGRFCILLGGSVILTYLTALIFAQVGKDKEHPLGFSNYLKICFMWGINATFIFLGVTIILTIRANGLYYFSWDAFAFSWYCGWLLMTPEMLLMIGWFAIYWVINSRIKKSINY